LGIRLKPGGFWKSSRPHIKENFWFFYMFLFIVCQIIDSNDDEVQQMKTFEGAVTMFGFVKG